MEVASYSVLKAKNVAQLLENNIIYRFRVPQEILLITVPILRGRFEGSWSCTTLSITSLYHTDHRGAIEAVNKNIKNILAKMVMTYKDCAKKLPFPLWGYRTSIRASTGATPYSLVYGCEVVLPIEVEIQSLRVLVETKVLEEDWMKERYKQLTLIDEKRAMAQYHA